ncbi:MAG: ROK family protein [Bacteroidales bacterium]|nr:ROK family protein [Bacteroidales bacterium]MDY4705070.1 ROK family protein [Prevotella sp.]MCI7654885.1 ROK family protein [Bacteroidales bacterium]MDD7706562.1 ROK family protein [Bacteroidales bacterium]MDY4951235.1 ROK family protein [Prevotella sp.]
METNKEMKPYVIGLDLGGTNSVFGIVDSRGDIKATTAVKTQAYEKVEDYVKACVEAVHVIIDQTGGLENIKAMGIGAPNGNFYTGSIEFAPNLSWGHDGIVPLADMFSKALGVPVALTNDANAAAIGEMTYGVARGMKNFIMITLGTGVGSGIVINGQIVYGSDGFAGELGHVIMVRENGRSCGCGRNGCLEAYCSATGVARTAREFLKESAEPSLLRDMKPEDITSLDVSLAAAKGDKLSKRVYEFTGEMLGEACADFATFSSPEAFVFFGGLTKAGDLLMKPLERSYRKHALAIFRDKPKFLVSSLDGASAAVLGASAVGWDL